MKFIPNYSTFRENINESFTPTSSSSASALSNATDVIQQFLNRKTKKDFKKFPMVLWSNGIIGYELYSNKDGSKVRVSGRGRDIGPGLVGSLSYFSPSDWNKAMFTVTSRHFPIVSLVGEFARLVSIPRYMKEVESGINESLNEASKHILSGEEKKIITKMLGSGESAASISRSLKIPYSSKI